MVRKFAHLDAPPERVRDLFADVDAWPLWMPGTERVEVTEHDRDRAVVLLRQQLRGWIGNQTMEFRFRRRGMRQIQRRGFFRRWEAEWRFLDPPDGHGTTVSCGFDFDLGIKLMLVPRSVVQSTLDHLFDDIIRGAAKHLESIGDEERMSKDKDSAVGDDGDRWLEIYETGAGLEVWLEGKRYVLQRMDEPR